MSVLKGTGEGKTPDPLINSNINRQRTTSVSAELSPELQTILQMMLAREPSERPTVSELLALPAVRRRRWKRRVYLWLAEAVLSLAAVCQVLQM